MVWSEQIGNSITIPSDKNSSDPTDTRDWIQVGGDLPPEFASGPGPITAGIIFYNGRWVGVGTEVKYLVIYPLSSVDGTTENLFIRAYTTTDGVGQGFQNMAQFQYSRFSGDAVSMYLSNPHDLSSTQSTHNAALVRNDTLNQYGLIVPDSAWTSIVPLLTAAWVPWDTGVDIPAYKKDSAGTVHLNGIVKLANNGSQLTAKQSANVCQLPAGYYISGKAIQRPVIQFDTSGVFLCTGVATISSTGMLSLTNTYTATVTAGYGWALAMNFASS